MGWDLEQLAGEKGPLYSGESGRNRFWEVLDVVLLATGCIN